MIETAYLTPQNLQQALQQAKENPGTFIFSAGGTDLYLRRQQQLDLKPVIIDLYEIEALRGIRREGEALVIGALATLHELATSPLLASWSPMVAEAARSVGTPVIRKTATVGGNLLVANRCTYYNQSAEWRESAGSCLRDKGDVCLATGGKDKCFSRNVSDLAPALIALGATAAIQDADSRLELALEDLYVPDGIRNHFDSGRPWILESIRLETPPSAAWFRKLRQRASLDFSSLTVAAARNAQGDLRVCIGAVSMSPVLLVGAPSLEDLQGQARRQCKTVDNDLMPLKYRRAMMEAFLQEAWEATVPR